MNSKQDVINWIEANRQRFIDVAQTIWANPELSFMEFKSSKLQADFLAAEGFSITWNIGGLNTSFKAEWGQGKPVIGFMGEYDALRKLSQSNQPVPDPVVLDGPGHGCGHNLLGTGSMAAAVAVKHWLESNKVAGTVRYYGCPAEEVGDGKAFMARDGVFNDLDAAFTYHPGSMNHAPMRTSVGSREYRFHYTGKAAHAGGAPHHGRSALDAVELMDVGVNYLREHVSEKVRIHYVITNGGGAPNIVPPEAEVWYFIRAPKLKEHKEVIARVCKVAEGAAMMTETQLKIYLDAGCSPVTNNHTLAHLLYEAMQTIGPIQYNSEELDFARKINSQFSEENVLGLLGESHLPISLKNTPIFGDNYWFDDSAVIGTGSSDVGDVSQNAPVCNLTTACFPNNVPGHCWAIVASGGTSIGHKGMLHAAKAMALAAIDLSTDPEKLRQVREEFQEAVADNPYECPIPFEIKPTHYDPPAE